MCVWGKSPSMLISIPREASTRDAEARREPSRRLCSIFWKAKRRSGLNFIYWCNTSEAARRLADPGAARAGLVAILSPLGPYTHIVRPHGEPERLPVTSTYVRPHSLPCTLHLFTQYPGVPAYSLASVVHLEECLMTSWGEDLAT